MNTLEIYWQNPETRERSLVGFLEDNENEYIFKYSQNVIQGKVTGFKPIYPFLNYEKEYRSMSMFSNFLNRIPSPKRNDINDILKKYGLEEYDEFNLLVKSGGRTPADNLEFISPIDTTANKIIRSFYIAGVSHGEFCLGQCDDSCLSEVTDYEIKLCKEPDNIHDQYAIKLLVEGKKIGYIPKYYSKSVTELINNNYKINIFIENINNDEKNCRECVKVILKAEK